MYITHISTLVICSPSVDNKTSFLFPLKGYFNHLCAASDSFLANISHTLHFCYKKKPNYFLWQHV